MLCLDSQILHSVSSVEGASDLLVCLHELLKLNVQFSVLLLQHVDVLLEGSNLSLNVRVSIEQTGIAESHFIQILSGVEDLVVSASVLGLQLIDLGRKLSVLLEFEVSLSQKSSSLFTLPIALSLKRNIVP